MKHEKTQQVLAAAKNLETLDFDYLVKIECLVVAIKTHSTLLLQEADRQVVDLGCQINTLCEIVLEMLNSDDFETVGDIRQLVAD